MKRILGKKSKQFLLFHTSLLSPMLMIACGTQILEPTRLLQEVASKSMRSIASIRGTNSNAKTSGKSLNRDRELKAISLD